MIQIWISKKGDSILFNNVLTYYDCVQKCRQTTSCVAITFYSKDYVQVRAHRTHQEPFSKIVRISPWASNSDVTDLIGAPTVCLLQSSVGTLTCDSTNYQTVTSGRFCEDETMCTNQVGFYCSDNRSFIWYHKWSIYWPVFVNLVVRHLWRNWIHCWTWLRTFWSCPVHTR